MKNTKTDNINRCFTLKLQSGNDNRKIVIYTYDDLGWDSAGRVKLSVEVRHGGKVIFPRGQLYCALHGSSDGVKARELVLSLVAMKPGDTDADYFNAYTPDQKDWVEAHGDAISSERESRYCDENGNIRA